ncbi:MAG: DUF1573 domain-containing protein [Candidatus Paceibacteria bacterium]
MKKQSKTNYVFPILIITGIIGFAILVLQGKNTPTSNTSASPLVTDVLIADEKSYDFGTISMQDGKVSKIFKVKNESQSEILLSKLYTSCMCTEATLIRENGRRYGPYGMPGHGPTILGQKLNPGEIFGIEVTFDPAAHGPAGIGQIVREVYLEGTKARLLTLRIEANVTP